MKNSLLVTTRLYIKGVIVFALIMFIASPSAWAVAINSDIGLTPSKDQKIIRSQVRFKRKSDDPTFLDRDFRTLSIPTTFVYGFTAKFAGSIMIPWLDKDLRTTSSGERITRETSGIGDIPLLAKYRVFTEDYPGGTSRLSVIGGLEVPSGETGDSDSHGKLPRNLQTGSGSWDPIAGFAYTQQSLDEEWDLNLTYQFNTEMHNFEFGDVLKYTLAYQHRILPLELPEEGLYTQLNVVLEANGEWSQKNENTSGSIDNSGGHLLFLSPGLQIAAREYVAEVSVQLPVFQDLNGDQTETDYVVVGSIRVTF